MRCDSSFLRPLFLAGTLTLAACAATPPQAPPQHAAVAAGPLRPFPPTTSFIDCVPYARAVSGLQLYGDAGTWWAQAARRYQRGSKPEIGAVLAWRASGSLTHGHVAVVVALQGPRQLLVSHANWGNDGETRGKIHERQPVIDVSPNNDWTEVRLVNRQGTFGRPYAAHGFIYQPTTDARAESRSN